MMFVTDIQSLCVGCYYRNSVLKLAHKYKPVYVTAGITVRVALLEKMNSQPLIRDFSRAVV